jgi:hypothetical protein
MVWTTEIVFKEIIISIKIALIFEIWLYLVVIFILSSVNVQQESEQVQ